MWNIVNRISKFYSISTEFTNHVKEFVDVLVGWRVNASLDDWQKRVPYDFFEVCDEVSRFVDITDKKWWKVRTVQEYSKISRFNHTRWRKGGGRRLWSKWKYKFVYVLIRKSPPSQYEIAIFSMRFPINSPHSSTYYSLGTCMRKRMLVETIWFVIAQSASLSHSPLLFPYMLSLGSVFWYLDSSRSNATSWTVGITM